MHMELFAGFIEKLKATPDGDGTLLDHSMIVYGSGLSDGNRHTHDDLPSLIVGRGGELPPRPPHRVSEGHADDEPLPDAARSHGRAGGDRSATAPGRSNT